MEILIDTSPLANQSSFRGIGRYTEELVASLRALPTEHTFFTSGDVYTHLELIHYPFFDLFFHTLPLSKKTKTVVTIHDVIPLIFPVHYKPGIRGSISLLVQKLSLRSVSAIIADSSCSARDICEHLRIASDKITAIPLAASASFAKTPQSLTDEARKKYDIPKNYLLYVGDINYNKNLPFLISVCAKIPDVTLVLLGRSVKNASIPEGREIRQAI